MAKSNKNELKEQKEKLLALDAEFARLNAIAKEYEKLEKLKAKGKQYDDARLAAIKDEYGSIDKLDRKIASIGDRYNEISKKVDGFNKRLEESLTNFDDLDSSLVSFSNGIGKLPGVYTKLEQKIQTTKSILGGITDILKDQNTIISDQQVSAVEQAADAYKSMTSEIANGQKALRKGSITQSQYNDLVKQAYENFETLEDRIDASTESGKQLKEVFAKAKVEASEFTKAAEKSQQKLEGMGAALDAIGNSGVPLLGELSQGLQNLANKDVAGATMAFRGLFAAIGALAANYFGAPWQVDIEMRNERIENQINALKQAGVIEVEFQAKGGANALSQLQDDGRGGAKILNDIVDKAGKDLADINNGVTKSAKDVTTLDLYRLKANREIDLDLAQARLDNATDQANVENKLQLEREKAEIDHQDEVNRLQIEARYASERAANAFRASMKSAAAEFRAASKTALFGDKLGGVGYGAAQLQMAGIGADRVAEAMSAASAATGKMPTAKAGSDMAVMAQRTGQSVENIASLNSMFMRTEGVTADVAMNLTEGMRELADNAGISLGNLMQEVADASKDALGYQIRSGKELAKQVAYAQSMGLSFGDIAKAGKSMVLNYRESIKAEMQLSTLLGEQVDLSEVRAKFAEGDTQGALEALKAQGLNPEDMDMFQQEALSQALGGMDLSSLQKIATKTGTEAGFGAADAEKANKKFLDRSIAAQQQLSSEQANISAQQAIIDAKTSEKALQAYLSSPTTAKLRRDALAQELKQQELDAKIRKQKLDNALNPEITARQQFISQLNMAYETLVSNMETLNPLIQQARIEQKQFEPEKQATNNLMNILGVGAGIGLFEGGKAGYKKIFGKTTGKEATEQVSKEVTQEATETATKVATQEISEDLYSQAAKGVGGDVTSIITKQVVSNLPGGKAAKIIMPVVGGATLLTTMGVMGSSEAHGQGNVVDPNAFMMQQAMKREQQAAAATQTGATPADGMGNQMQAGFTSLCSCVNGLMGPLNNLEELRAIRADNELAAKGQANLIEKVKDREQKEAGIGAAVNFVGEYVVGGALDVAKNYIGKQAPKLGLKSVLGNVVKSGNFLKGAGLGAGGALLRGFGDMKKEMAMMRGDMGELTTGRLLDTAGQALEYAAYGMAFGPVGALVGGGIGLLKGVYDNFFSSKSKEEEARVKAQQEAIRRHEENMAAIDRLIDVQENVNKSFEYQAEQSERMRSIAEDEVVWREGVLTQLVQMTKFQEMLLFKGAYGDEITVGGTTVKRTETQSEVDRSSRIAAERLGIGQQLTQKEKGLELLQSKVKGGMVTGSKAELFETMYGKDSEEYKMQMKAAARLQDIFGGENTFFSQKTMTYAEAEKLLGVKKEDLESLARKQQINAVATQKQQEMAVQSATQAGGAAGGPTPAGGPAPIPTTGGPTPTPTVTTGGPTPTVKTGGPAPAGGGPAAGGLALDTTMQTISTTLTTIQTQADSRGQTMYALMQGMQTSLNNMATVNMTATLDKLLLIEDGIRKDAHTRGIIMFNKTLETNTQLKALNATVTQLKMINEGMQKLLDAQLSGNEGKIQLLIDGTQVTRVIKRRAQDRMGMDETTESPGPVGPPGPP